MQSELHHEPISTKSARDVNKIILSHSYIVFEDVNKKVMKTNKTNRKCHTVGPVPNSNRQIVERNKMDSLRHIKYYSHYFITSAFLKEFWTKCQNLMKGYGIETKITLKHIVLGYKIDDKNYLALICLITVVGFSIYKSYYISEQKTKYINVYRIVVNELKDNNNNKKE